MIADLWLLAIAFKARITRSPKRLLTAKPAGAVDAKWCIYHAKTMNWKRICDYTSFSHKKPSFYTICIDRAYRIKTYLRRECDSGIYRIHSPVAAKPAARVDVVHAFTMQK